MHQLTVDEIRARYPAARRAPGWFRWGADAYCVGGACVRAALPWRGGPCFPRPEDIALALQTLNPALRGEVALDYAWRMVHENDAGRMDAAWELVALALKESS